MTIKLFLCYRTLFVGKSWTHSERHDLALCGVVSCSLHARAGNYAGCNSLPVPPRCHGNLTIQILISSKAHQIRNFFQLVRVTTYIGY